MRKALQIMAEIVEGKSIDLQAAKAEIGGCTG
jgi:hypothetical protein